MFPVFILWSLLAVVVIALAVYRRVVATHEDDLIHFGAGQERLVSQQSAVTERLERVDRLGKTLTIVVAVSGVLLAAVYVYNVWMESTRLPG